MAFCSAKYYPDVIAGRVFIGSTAAAGTALPISTGTAVTCGIWNTNPNAVAVILAVNIGFTSGTIAIGEFGLANQNCGYAIGSAAPLSAFNAGTPKNAYLGYGLASSMSFTPAATTTLTSGGTACLWSGYSNEVATAAQPVAAVQWNVDGQCIVGPGQLCFVCGSVAQTGLFTVSMIWAEIPLS